MNEQLELFPIRIQDAQDWLRDYALTDHKGIDGKVIRSHMTMHSKYAIGGDYLLIRFEDDTFIVFNSLQGVQTIGLLATVREEEIVNQFSKFFTPLELNYIRELRSVA